MSLPSLPPGSHAFHLPHTGLANALITPISLYVAFNPAEVDQAPEPKQYTALWDTGATGTVITERVVNELGLEPITRTIVYNAGGSRTSGVYLVNVKLPNNVGIANVRVTDGVLGEIDVLVGMDIISKGDFAITNYGGNTHFSFRIPSAECINFVEQANRQAVPSSVEKVGRNEPCPCGSGKKYKKCHGK